MKKFLFFVLAMITCVFNASADNVNSINSFNAANIVSSVNLTDGEKLKTIATLENDLTILDSEILKCEKSKKGWIAATVIGSAGVVATGVAAGVQGAKIAEKKQTLSEHNVDIDAKKQKLESLQEQQQ